MRTQFIVFTDLDGTLLDHNTYAFNAALPALKVLKERDIPLILVSSKTRLELLDYQKLFNLENLPFVVENGAAIFTPLNYFDSLPNPVVTNNLTCYCLGKKFAEIKQVLNLISKKYKYFIKGYHNATPEEIATKTGLRGEFLIRSLSREFSIPIFYDQYAEEVLKKEAETYKLQILYGGRFMHLLSQTDKGMALELIMRGYREKMPSQEIKSIALGDSLNDFSMLEQADYPILVKKHDGSFESRAKLENIIYSSDIGPKGWNQSLLHILNSGGENE
jgi:mannosyl-3-phosphoglycerate phosphatase